MNTAELKPLRDIVIVKAEPKSNTSKGGIVTNTKADEKPTEGTIMAMGPDTPGLAVGNTVAFTTNIIREDKGDDGVVFLWMTTENVLGVVSNG